ncbi:MAG: gas vesicle protein [Paracoccaceae bacterium]
MLDRLLDRGVVIRGELWLTVADVELVFIGADLVIASAERMRLAREEIA